MSTTLTHVQREEIHTALLAHLAEWVDAGADEMHLDGLLDVDSLPYDERGFELTVREGVRLLFMRGEPVHFPSVPIKRGTHDALTSACDEWVLVEDTTVSRRVNVGLRPLCSRCVAAERAGRGCQWPMS